MSANRNNWQLDLPLFFSKIYFRLVGAEVAVSILIPCKAQLSTELLDLDLAYFSYFLRILLCVVKRLGIGVTTESVKNPKKYKKISETFI
jgi:hypothetical protein